MGQEQNLDITKGHIKNVYLKENVYLKKCVLKY